MTDTSDAGHLADDLSAEVVDPWARHGWLLAAVWLVFLLFPATEVAQVTGDRPILRVVGWGVPAALLVAAAALGPRWRRAGSGGLGTRLAARLGDASYALYLSHPFVIFGFRKAWVAAGLHDRLGYWPMLAASLVLACAVALLVHHLVEKPLTTWLQARTAPRPAAAISPPNAA